MSEQWIFDLNKELQLPHTAPVQKLYAKSIYRIPKILTDENSQAYEPKLASFGPYHHNRRHLRPMEQHKHRALIQFLRRIAKASKTPEDVIAAMRNVEPALLASYDSLRIQDDDDEECLEQDRFHHHDWLNEKDEFLKVMIMDSCFVLEVMLAEKRSNAKEQSEYDSQDPIFGTIGMRLVVPYLKRDMVLLENQLPLLALTTMAAIEDSGVEDVRTLIEVFYNLPSVASSDESLHILDMYKKVLTPEGEYLPSYEQNVKSATELRSAGISFRKSNSKSFRNISFNDGVLSLPPLEIDNNTESLLLNLMAFEYLHAAAGNKVTTFVFFMNGLINTKDDVALLRTGEIIRSWVGCNEDIAKMFNKITTTLAVFKDDIRVDGNSELNSYCKKRRHRWRASFVEAYLKNPLIFISQLAVLFLLFLAALRIVFSMLQFYKRN